MKLTSTYKSPRCPPRTPALPCPLTRMVTPDMTPGGISTEVSLKPPSTRPSPLHCEHSFVMRVPCPWHSGQTDCICTMPPMTRWFRRTKPAPAQVPHLANLGRWPSCMPEALHALHSVCARNLTSRLAPRTASLNRTLTWTRMSSPSSGLPGKACERPPPPPGPHVERVKPTPTKPAAS